MNTGTNLDPINYFSSQFAFTDAMRYARPWLPQEAVGSVWDTKRPLALTPDGWPLLADGQAAGTIIYRDVGGKYPGGKYLASWEGDGVLAWKLDAKLVQSPTPNSAELDVTPSPGGIVVKLMASNRDKPLHNLSIVPVGATGEFRPEFLDSLKGYTTIRFMDWQFTNDSTVTGWKDRTPYSRPMQGWTDGVSPELIVALCNRVGADPWICFPHLADDDYVRRYCEVFATFLDPSLRVYVEWSNETWNSIFTQTAYCKERGRALALDPNEYQATLKFHAKRSQEVWKAARSVLGCKRAITVMAGQHGNPGVLTTRLAYLDAWKDTDAIAIAPYFSAAGIESAPQTLDAVFRLAEADIRGRCARLVADHVAIAAKYGKPLLAYEGGQHLVSKVQETSDLFIAANREPRMGKLYEQFLRMWPGSVFCHMNNVRWPGISGAWGAQEYTGQPEGECPKLLALRKAMDPPLERAYETLARVVSDAYDRLEEVR